MLAYFNYALEIRSFEANKFLKAQFTFVNEHFKKAVQRKKTIYRDVIYKLL